MNFKINNTTIAIVISLIFVFNIMVSVISSASQSENIFTLSINNEENTTKVSLSVNENVNFCGFDAVLNYDKAKYKVISKTSHSSVLINDIQNKGELLVSFSGTNDIKSDTDIFEIVFERTGSVEDIDFKFEITDIYDASLKNVDYSISKVMNGKNEYTSDNMSISTNTVTTYDSQINNYNCFNIVAKENADGTAVDLTFSVNGDVEFYIAEGKINLDLYGLSDPELKTSISDALSSYDAEDNCIYFTVISSTGKNITSQQDIFTYSFDKENNEYLIKCNGIMSLVADQNNNDKDYSVTFKDNTSSSNVVTSAITTITNNDITTVTTTDIPNHTSHKTETGTSTITENNIFGIDLIKNSDGKSIDLIFSVSGNVKFYIAEGKINLRDYQSGIPELKKAIPDVMSAYNENDRCIYFTIIGSTGTDITSGQEIFSYSIPTGDEIICEGIMSLMLDQNNKDVNYSFVYNNDSSNPQNTTIITTTSITTSDTSSLITTVTNNSTTPLSTTSQITTTTVADNDEKIYGDVDNNGVVNSRDIMMLKQYLLLVTDKINIPNGDLDEDGRITVIDLVNLIKLFLNY